MGKFERGEAEKLEKDVVKILNSHPCASNLANRIREDFQNQIINAEFIGRNYNEPCNIKLNLNNNRIAYIELKLLKSGKGTRANLSQNALTNFNLFSGENIKSWSSFREENNFDNEVLRILNSYEHYDENKLQSYRENNEKIKKARYLKDIIKPNKGESIERAIERLRNNQDVRIRRACEIVSQILTLAKKDKLRYINYLRTLNQNPEFIKKFSILILLGFHKESAIRQGFENFDSIIQSIGQNYIYKTYYVNRLNCEMRCEDLTNLINELLNSCFRISFPENETNCLIEYRPNNQNEWRKLLRIVFHWKNVFQGIKTPCLNIFDEFQIYRH